ncbi:hypothetical protein A9Q81_27855 [Gammaproteobacteria bacterium 42_54_T18]|nr:hypothetical protein A9Q81_27855 [Gammaproteobacteria bacterium 42_54_T18]
MNHYVVEGSNELIPNNGQRYNGPRYGGSTDKFAIGAGIATGLGQLAKDGALIRAAQKFNAASTVLRGVLTHPVAVGIAAALAPNSVASDNWSPDLEAYVETLIHEGGDGMLPGQTMDDRLQGPVILPNPIASPGVDRPLDGYSPVFIDDSPLTSPAYLDGSLPSVLPGHAPVSQGVDIVYSNSVKDAIKSLDEGSTRVGVQNRGEAEQLFLERFQGLGYRNAQDFNSVTSKEYFTTAINGRESYYHWDDTFVTDPETGVEYIQHHNYKTDKDAFVRHLQLHPAKGKIIKIYFGE